MYCLAYVLLKVKSELESLKPIDYNVYDSMQRQTTLNVKKVDLFLKYELNPSEPFLSKEYNGNIIRLYRKVDKKPFIARQIVKMASGQYSTEKEEMDRLLSECDLLQAVDSEYVERMSEVYELGNEVFVLFEEMNRGSLD